MLKNFKLVNTDGLQGLFIKGRLLPFDKIDDTMAEQLIGKTHVLERVPGPELALAAPAAEQLAGLPEAATAVKKKDE